MASILDIMKEMNPNPKELHDVDTDNGLMLAHFETCTNTSSQEIKDKRGIITTLDGTVVCKTFPFIEEYTPVEVKNLEIKNLRFFDSHEGTLLRLYNYNNKWFLSTHKKIDAFDSYWGSRDSFGQLFINALQYELKEGKEINTENTFDNYCFKLDSKKSYCFLVRHNLENRIVCDAPQNPTIYCMGVFDKEGKLLEYGQDNSSGISSPVEYKFKNIRDVIEHVNNINYKKTQGLIVYRENGTLFKITNKKYHELYNIRGNQPSLKFRYLQVRKNDELTAKLIKLYPYKEVRFEYYENNLRLLANKIYTAYVDRFINKKYVIVEKPQYAVLMTAHNLYLQGQAKITQELIYSLINDLDASKMMSLLRSLEYNKQSGDE